MKKLFALSLLLSAGFVFASEPSLTLDGSSGDSLDVLMGNPISPGAERFLSRDLATSQQYLQRASTHIKDLQVQSLQLQNKVEKLEEDNKALRVSLGKAQEKGLRALILTGGVLSDSLKGCCDRGVVNRAVEVKAEIAKRRLKDHDHAVVSLAADALIMADVKKSSALLAKRGLYLLHEMVHRSGGAGNRS